jgi:hypothetical protein
VSWLRLRSWNRGFPLEAAARKQKVEERRIREAFIFVVFFLLIEREKGLEKKEKEKEKEKEKKEKKRRLPQGLPAVRYKRERSIRKNNKNKNEHREDLYASIWRREGLWRCKHLVLSFFGEGW